MTRDNEVVAYFASICGSRTEGHDATLYAMVSCAVIPEAGNVAFVRWLTENDCGFVILAGSGRVPMILADKRSVDEFNASGGVIVPMATPTIAYDGTAALTPPPRPTNTEEEKGHE